MTVAGALTGAEEVMLATVGEKREVGAEIGDGDGAVTLPTDSELAHSVASKVPQSGVKVSNDDAALNDAERGQEVPVELRW